MTEEENIERNQKKKKINNNNNKNCNNKYRKWSEIKRGGNQVED